MSNKSRALSPRDWGVSIFAPPAARLSQPLDAGPERSLAITAPRLETCQSRLRGVYFSNVALGAGKMRRIAGQRGPYFPQRRPRGRFSGGHQLRRLHEFVPLDVMNLGLDQNIHVGVPELRCGGLNDRKRTADHLDRILRRRTKQAWLQVYADYNV